ncbi:MAG TPA: hypothetical protein VN445_14910 [Rectinemataceae bacterium]|nr:hypothetical protein [Rectinemataceae bacterium]
MSLHAEAGNAAQGAIAAARVMTVHVTKSQIRESPSVIAPILATVAYRAKVSMYASVDGWAKVQVPGSTRYGYMFMSALTEKTIDASDAGKAASGITGSEIALAGKGFSESVEESYRKNSRVDYSWVDAMERYAYPSETVIGFLAGSVEQ